MRRYIMASSELVLAEAMLADPAAAQDWPALRSLRDRVLSMHDIAVAKVPAVTACRSRGAASRPCSMRSRRTQDDRRPAGELRAPASASRWRQFADDLQGLEPATGAEHQVSVLPRSRRRLPLSLAPSTAVSRQFIAAGRQ